MKECQVLYTKSGNYDNVASGLLNDDSDDNLSNLSGYSSSRSTNQRFQFMSGTQLHHEEGKSSTADDTDQIS